MKIIDRRVCSFSDRICTFKKEQFHCLSTIYSIEIEKLNEGER